MERSRIETSRRPGRPRDARATQAIRDAAIALVREVGFEAVAMEQIAARAGVGKATVYRHWPSKEAVVVEALRELVGRLPVPDTGSLRGDLIAVQDDTLGLYADPATRLLLVGLTSAMARSEAIAAAVREGFHAARVDATRAVLLRGGVDPGEVELAVDLLNGPLYFRTLWTGAPLSAAYAHRLVDVALATLPRSRP